MFVTFFLIFPDLSHVFLMYMILIKKTCIRCFTEIKNLFQGIVIGKNYTVVLETLNDELQNYSENDSDACHLHLMIKIYEDGALTPVLDQLQVGMYIISTGQSNFTQQSNALNPYLLIHLYFHILTLFFIFTYYYALIQICSLGIFSPSLSNSVFLWLEVRTLFAFY